MAREGEKKVNLYLTAQKPGFVILVSESAHSITTLLKRPDNSFFASHFSISAGGKPTELHTHITLYLVLLLRLAALRRPPSRGQRHRTLPAGSEPAPHRAGGEARGGQREAKPAGTAGGAPSPTAGSAALPPAGAALPGAGEGRPRRAR